MPTQAQVPEVIDAIKTKLHEAAKQGIRLKVIGEQLEDDWLHVVIVPDQPGVRASDHARLMAQIERQLREEGFENVLLVPAVED